MAIFSEITGKLCVKERYSHCKANIWLILHAHDNLETVQYFMYSLIGSGIECSIGTEIGVLEWPWTCEITPNNGHYTNGTVCNKMLPIESSFRFSKIGPYIIKQADILRGYWERVR